MKRNILLCVLFGFLILPSFSAATINETRDATLTSIDETLSDLNQTISDLQDSIVKLNEAKESLNEARNLILTLENSQMCSPGNETQTNETEGNETSGTSSVNCVNETVTTEALTEVLSNGGFENNKNSWSFYSNANANFVIDNSGFNSNDAAKIDVLSQGSNVQLYQFNIDIEQGETYRLSFDAYSNTGHNMDVILQRHGSPYTNLGLSVTPDLTSSWKNFEYEFVASGGDSNSRLRFWFSPYDNAGDDFFIDNVKLELVEESTEIIENCTETNQTEENLNNSNFFLTSLSSKNSQDMIEVPNNGSEQTASIAADFNNDGIKDFVIAERTSSPSVVLYLKKDLGWEKHTIESDALNIEAGSAYHDIDGDGDLDIVLGGDWQSNKVWWWENPYPNFNSSWTRYLIKDSGSDKHHDQIFGDFDGDNSEELVFWNQEASKLFLAEIPSNPRTTEPWNFVEIFSYTGDEREGLAKEDINQDGILDIVGGGSWFGYDGTSYNENIIDSSQEFSRAASGQLVSGGRPEIVFVVGDGIGPLNWYEWNGSEWESHELLSNVDHGHSLDIVDFNGDGNLDIFVAEMRLDGGNSDSIMAVFLGDGNGNFERHDLANSYGNHESKVADLDGDGDMDILGKPYNWDAPRLDIWLQKQSLDNWERVVIDDSRPWRSIFIEHADVNGDGLEDIITGGWWYENPSWQRHEIGSSLNNMAIVYDLDSDGDLDILGTKGIGSNPNAEFVLAENDGFGNFTTYENISNGNGDFLQGVSVFEGEIFLSWHNSSVLQSLEIPENPFLDNWSIQDISNESLSEEINFADLTKDGSSEIVMGTSVLELVNSSWISREIYSTTEESDRNRIADFDKDGDLDIVIGYETVGLLSWYENNEALSNWIENTISNSVVGPMSLDSADIDGDDDIDLVIGEHNLANSQDASVVVFENELGSWKTHEVYQGDEHHDGTQLVDFDKDGDLDIISIGWSHDNVLLYENKAI